MKPSKPWVAGEKYNSPDVTRLIVGFLIAVTTAQAPAPPAQGTATAGDELSRARHAVLGRHAPEGIRSLRLEGRLRVGISRDEAVDGLVDIRVLLPDRYLRLDSVNGTERRSGFKGRTSLTSGGDVMAERASFVRLMLGLIAFAPPEPKLAFESTGEPAFADTIAVDVAASGFAARMVFDSMSHIPLRLVYDSRYGAGTVMSFANRRDVDGVQLPSRVTTLIADRVLETLMFDEMQVNPDLHDTDFSR
jgi:hypothetical protein